MCILNCGFWLQANAKGEATASSNALAKARAWVESKGSWAGVLAAAGVALLGTELVKRAAGAVPGMVMGHHHAGTQMTVCWKLDTPRMHCIFRLVLQSY